MNCEQQMTQGHRGMCGADAAGYSRIWQINRKDIETVTYSTVAGKTDMITSFTLAAGTNAYLLPFQNKSVDPKGELVQSDILNRYKHTVIVNTFARTVEELANLRAVDQVFIFECKQDVVGGGKYIAYGFECGLSPSANTHGLLTSGHQITYSSYDQQLESVQYRIIHNATNAATRLMLDGFLAA